MASKTISSSAVTFLDLTDARKIDVHIASSFPTVQIYNPNATNNRYTPDWTSTPLTLSPSVFLGSKEVTADSGTSFVWYRQVGTDTKTQVSTNRVYSVSTNELADGVGIITYICEAAYQGVSDQAAITFSRVDTGKDGQGISIKGTAASVAAVTGTDYYTITYGAGVVQTASIGDAYLYSSDLYICADSRDGVDYFINVGRIQGEKGENAKNIILSGDSQIFKVSKTNTITPATIKVGATAVNTNITTWSYSTNGGQSFLTTAPTGVSRSGNTVTVTGSTLTTNSLVIKASDGTYSDSYTLYKVYDGVDGEQGGTGQAASMAFLTNENITFSADESGKIIGTTTSFTTNVVAYNGTTKTTPVIGTISGLPQGMSADTSTTVVNNEKIIIFSFAANATLGSTSSNSGTITIPVISPISTNLKLNWSKINTGISGRGIKTVVEYYAVNNNKETAPTTWVTTTPTMDSNNQYLWNYEEITYTDENKESTNPVIIGIYSGEGRGISTVTNYYLATGVTSGITNSTTGWTTTPQTMSATNKYLWSHEKITYTKGNPTETTPHIIGVYGDKGEAGRGIVSIVEHYAVSASNTTAPTTWQDTVPATTITNRYLWNYETITYTTGSPTDTLKRVIGVHGATGTDGRGITAITNYYLATASASGVAHTTTGWTTVVQNVTATKKYLWNYEEITYTMGNPTKTDPCIIGAYGDKGETGTPASLVKINPSALYFKSTTGSTGPFSPEYVYLMPTFQSVTYSKWQYSLDNGQTWVDAVNTIQGLSIGTYYGVPNSLAINKASSLYTNERTSVSFKCVSNNSAIYDIVSIAKIYDVVDLQIGGRNIVLNTNKGTTGWDWRMQTGGFTKSEVIEDGVKCCKFVRDNVTASGWSYFAYATEYMQLDKFEAGKTYAISMEVKPSVATQMGMNIVEGNAQNSLISQTIVNSLSQTMSANVWNKIYSVVKIKDVLPTIYAQILYLNSMNSGVGVSYILRNLKIEEGNVPTSWSPAVEDLIEEASNTSVILSNESHLFEADSNGIPTPTSIVLDVVGFKGATQSAATVGAISGLPSAGMTATIASNGTTSTTITIAVSGLLTSAIADYGVLTIPITVNGKVINKKFSWSKSKAGAVGSPGEDAVTFQVYSNNGYALSINTPVVTLQTFAYVGDVEITAGATYQWYSYPNNAWTAISGATKAYLDVSRNDVSFSNSYMCKMTFNNTEYTSVVTVDDKNDENKVFTTKPVNYTAGDLWVVGSDYVPSDVEIGTLLRAEHTNITYADGDWVNATKYDGKLSDLEKNVKKYNQSFNFDQTNGVTISAVDADGNKSDFSTTISNTQLSFNEGGQSIASISGSKMHIREAEIESPLTVVGRYSGSTMLQAPVINIGNFSIVVESNGSLSIIANT